MRKLLLGLWLGGSALMLLITVLLSYMCLMMGAVHWDWWLSLGLGLGFVAIGAGCFWMCRRSFRLLRGSDVV